MSNRVSNNKNQKENGVQLYRNVWIKSCIACCGLHLNSDHACVYCRAMMDALIVVCNPYAHIM